MATGTAAQRQEGTAQPLLQADGLVKLFGGLRAVDGVSLALERGEIVGLIGPNGAGKTTLFNLLAGSLRADRRPIRLAGATIDRRAARAAHRRAASAAPSRSRGRFPTMTVLENVWSAPSGQTGERILAQLAAPRRGRAEERAAVEQGDARPARLRHPRPLAHAPARMLSGGQRKLLELARVLMAEPAAHPARRAGGRRQSDACSRSIIARIAELNRARHRPSCSSSTTWTWSRASAARVLVMAQRPRCSPKARRPRCARDPRVIEAYLGGAAA